MLFSKRQQLITSYQANNAGSDVAREIKTLTTENIGDYVENQSRNWLGISKLAAPPFSEGLWLDNNAHL